MTAEPTLGRLEVRFAVHRERLRLAAMLDELAPEEWDQQSLCPGWRVRDVVAHTVLGPQTTIGELMIEFARARGDVHRMSLDTARRRAEAPTAILVAELRAAADSDRRVPFTTARDPLAGILVHTQDIAIPLHRTLPMPVVDAAVAAAGMWQNPFYATRRRVRGLRLAATDVTWVRGEGGLVQGPIEAILLALAGRPAGLRRLTGPGVAILAERLDGPCRP
ncbi:MAG TPA: maleylpyruvate isomerase family mycothiol-dependent enzyme [Micromonosporaceae bacterium]|nr:maleylpyruvate isomerase family mycothiol-dependent enzyme [Micromonosporaceae bacterium]